MGTAPSHKDKLLRHGRKRFYATGYGGTSVETVLQDARVPKGSLYHHFGSKEGFAMAVVQDYHRHSAARLARWAGEASLPAPQRLAGYLHELADALERTGNRYGCLVGKFTLELAPASEPFRVLLGTMLDAWQDGVEGIVRDGQDAGTIRADVDSSSLATLVLSSIQGAVLLSLARRSSAPMSTVATLVPSLLVPPDFDTR